MFPKIRPQQYGRYRRLKVTGSEKVWATNKSRIFSRDLWQTTADLFLNHIALLPRDSAVPAQLVKDGRQWALMSKKRSARSSSRSFPMKSQVALYTQYQSSHMSDPQFRHFRDVLSYLNNPRRPRCLRRPTRGTCHPAQCHISRVLPRCRPVSRHHLPTQCAQTSAHRCC